MVMFGRMNLWESGRRLFRRALLLRKCSALWRNFSHSAMGNECKSLNVRTVVGVPCLWNVQRSSKLFARSNAYRFFTLFSQTESEGRAVTGTEVSENAPEQETIAGTIKDAAHVRSHPEELQNAASSKESEQWRLFCGQLQACRAPVDVLELSAQHSLTRNRTSMTLGCVWKTLKTIPEEQKSYHVQLVYEHPAFKELCALLVHDSQKMRCSDVVYCLLAVVRLGVSQRSRLVQTLLRVTQENLNELDEKSLSVLAGCLGNMENCKNVSALKQGLSLLAWSRVPTIQNVVALQSLMRCLGTEVPVNMKKRLEEKALSMANQFTLPNAQYMFITLASMNFSSKPLLDICREKLIENIQAIPFNRLLQVLKACKTLSYQDYCMLSAISDYVESTFDVWNQKQLVLYLLAFEGLGFYPGPLMDRIADKLIQNPTSFTKREVVSILRTYSSLNHNLGRHRKEFLDSVDIVLQSYLPRMSPAELLHTVFFLCVLGHLPCALVETLLQEDTLNALLPEDSGDLQTTQHKLRFIDRCLRLDHPSAPFRIPAGTIPPYPSHPSPPVNRDLMNTLQSIVGDEAVQHAVLLDSGYFIDYLIMLPQCGRRSESVTPKSFLRLAVLKGYTAFFCLGTHHLRGHLAVKLRHLKVLGYTPVLVHEDELEHLRADERERVLTNLVQSATAGALPPLL